MILEAKMNGIPEDKEDVIPILDKAVNNLAKLGAAFREKENGTSDTFINLSHLVIPLGLEPRTHTLKVYCSTN